MNKKLLMTIFGIAALGGVCTGCEKKEEGNNGQNNNEPAKVEEKKLTCTMTETEDKVTGEIKYTFNFKGDESFEKATLRMQEKYATEKDAEKPANSAKDDCKKINETAKGASCNVVTSKNLVTSTITFTMANLDDKGKSFAEEAGLKEVEGKKYDDVKSTLEKATFKCE